MAVPSNPSLAEIVAEGLKQGGEHDPSSSLTTRAQEEWMPEILNDIYLRTKKLRDLMTTAYAVIPKGQRRFSFPTDYGSVIELTLLSGNDTGTATAGSTNSITLAADEDVSEGNIVGRDILVTSGIGQGSCSTVISYSESTKVAGVAPDFQVSPGSGSTYMIIAEEYPIDQRPMFQFNNYRKVSLERPEVYFPIGDEDYGEFVFDTAPDQQYGARLRYFADITRLDTDGTLISTLYRKWRNLFVQGIKYRKLADEDDGRSNDEYTKYLREIQKLVNSEIYGKDLSGLQDHVADYC